jgi:hypothetical protein
MRFPLEILYSEVDGMTDRDERDRSVESSGRALRLTFSYTGGDVELAARQRVDMTAPPGETNTLERGRAGSWLELMDDRGRVLYQRVLHSPIRYDVEVAEVADERRLRRRPVDTAEGIFQVVVPDLPATQTIRLFTSTPESDEPAVESLRMSRADVDSVRGGGA